MAGRSRCLRWFASRQQWQLLLRRKRTILTTCESKPSGSPSKVRRADPLPSLLVRRRPHRSNACPPYLHHVGHSRFLSEDRRSNKASQDYSAPQKWPMLLVLAAMDQTLRRSVLLGHWTPSRLSVGTSAAQAPPVKNALPRISNSISHFRFFIAHLDLVPTHRDTWHILDRLKLHSKAAPSHTDANASGRHTRPTARVYAHVATLMLARTSRGSDVNGHRCAVAAEVAPRTGRPIKHPDHISPRFTQYLRSTALPATAP